MARLYGRSWYKEHKRQGRYAGQFHHARSIAIDSKGNIYVAETQGTRVQRFLFKGVSSASSSLG